ncbi:peptidoglycan-binding protein [Thioclava sediminum]|uniref:Peptidoglycan-binding protein n=1 Tax=Thioclava sediminum TaxID=1915319 RepID=A0ABX3MS05_9RHOB|nr:holin-associated N-acetylmuramidase [Thioclava sediminum]OOY22482.1 peptidoglycan-binding protein [Thioclava sediminum]
MKTVLELAREIVAREGGYVNDPSDPGGATNHGVTIGTLRRLGLDLDHDGDIDTDDVKQLTKTQAADIFLEHYFRGPHIDELPRQLRSSVFDMYVNSGANAVKILQRLLSGRGYPCSDDGVIGPHTLRQARAATDADPHGIADAYAVSRRNYYFALADARPASRKYCRTRAGRKGGWIRRAEEFMSPQCRLTSAQFNERISRWA